jgi:hypothetical protein
MVKNVSEDADFAPYTKAVETDYKNPLSCLHFATIRNDIYYMD